MLGRDIVEECLPLALESDGRGGCSMLGEAHRCNYEESMRTAVRNFFIGGKEGQSLSRRVPSIFSSGKYPLSSNMIRRRTLGTGMVVL